MEASRETLGATSEPLLSEKEMRDELAADVAKTFVCDKCASPAPAFATAKALEQHQRSKHKLRSVIKFFIGDRSWGKMTRKGFTKGSA